jgi:hypothetical protein
MVVRVFDGAELAIASLPSNLELGHSTSPPFVAAACSNTAAHNRQ